MARNSFLAALVRALLVLTCVLSAMGDEQAQRTEGPRPPALTTASIVQKLVAANARRAEALHGYRQTRSYSLNYHGFPGGRSAAMKVDASFTAPDKKEFTVVSQSGSQFLINHVLQKLLDSEKDAWQGQNGKQMELTPDNYDFAFLQMERTPQGESYVLAVKPKVNSKYLYKGKIWVDARDFAVTRIAAQPAKNPSFWVSHTEIDTHYAKFGDFWLPLHNESVTHVRFGGDAVLQIDYADYQINGANQVQNAHPSGQVPVLPPATAVSGDPH
jgi:hypothetical protein